MNFRADKNICKKAVEIKEVQYWDMNRKLEQMYSEIPKYVTWLSIQSKGIVDRKCRIMISSGRVENASQFVHGLYKGSLLD